MSEHAERDPFRLQFSPEPEATAEQVPALQFLSGEFARGQWRLSADLQERPGKVVSAGMGGSALPIRALLEEPHSGRITVVDHPDWDLLERAAEGAEHLVGVSKSGRTRETRAMLDALLDLGDWQSVTVVTGGDSPLADRAADAGWNLVPFTAECDGRFGLFAAATLTPFRLAGLDPSSAVVRAGESRRAAELGCRLGSWLGERIESGMHQLAVLCYEDRLWHLGRWLQQLVGESLGKRGRGMFPALLLAPAAHHSVFQHLEQGAEGVAVLQLAGPQAGGDDADQLQRLRRASYAAARDTLSGDRPVASLEAGGLDRFHLAAIGKAFVHAVFRAAEVTGVNPEGQPGVEGLKRRLSELIDSR